MKTLGIVTLVAAVLLPTASWAVCRQGQVPASCTSGFMGCCMPAGARDLGNGRHQPAAHQGQWHGPRTERDQLRHDQDQNRQRREQMGRQDRQHQPQPWIGRPIGPAVMPYQRGQGTLLQRPGGQQQWVQPRPLPQPGPTPGFGRCQGPGCAVR